MSPYGGLVPILKKVKDYGIPQLINARLGKKAKQSTYSHAAIFINWLIVALCNGRSIYHIRKLEKKLPYIKKIRIVSHDTLGRGMKRLATETMTVHSESREQDRKIRTMEVNDNMQLNQLLVEITKRMGAIKEGPKYVLDYDATFIPTMCRGAVRKYKKDGKLDYNKIGFSPMICMIGDLPVFISNRNGDAGSRFQVGECLEKCLDTLAASKIRIGRVISDSAGFTKKAMALMDARGIKFNMRFPAKKNMEAFSEQLRKCKTWRKTEIETANYFWDVDIADIKYVMSNFQKGKPAQQYRVVALRRFTSKVREELERMGDLPNKEVNKAKIRELTANKVLKEPAKAFQDKHWKKIGRYEYKFYVTNDWDIASEDIVIEYNNRGTAERKFHFMKEDFAWELPPFMRMNENTVFLIAASIANNILRSAQILFKKELPMLTRKSQLINFFKYFILVSCAYMGNGVYAFSHDEIDYVKLM